jgi:hypothetical protein
MADENVNDSDVCEAYDALTAKLSKLQAMLYMTYGNATETFNAMSDTLRENYMWACAGLIDECVELAPKLSRTDA